MFLYKYILASPLFISLRRPQKRSRRRHNVIYLQSGCRCRWEDGYYRRHVLIVQCSWFFCWPSAASCGIGFSANVLTSPRHSCCLFQRIEINGLLGLVSGSQDFSESSDDWTAVNGVSTQTHLQQPCRRMTSLQLLIILTSQLLPASFTRVFHL